MPTIQRDSLLTLEAYAKARPDFRKKAIEHKANRKVFIGKNVMLQFEDELTMRYQIQEILRVEKSFEEKAIQEELEAYNPLVPDGDNWKATLSIEFPNEAERKQKLVELKGLERHTYVQVGNLEKVYAIADEDLPRETEEKTSAIHFLRFQLSAEMIRAVKNGDAIAVGIDLPAYTVHVPEIAPQTQASICKDLS